jgi:hypothetical protein
MMQRVGSGRQWPLVLIVLVFGVVLTTAGCGKPAAGAAGASATSRPPSIAAPPSDDPTRHRPQHHSPKVTGEITAINGSTWTVHTAGGPLFTVILTPATRFGTTKHPATREQFSVGSHVTVHGTISGVTITATQITFQKIHIQQR